MAQAALRVQPPRLTRRRASALRSALDATADGRRSGASRAASQGARGTHALERSAHDVYLLPFGALRLKQPLASARRVGVRAIVGDGVSARSIEAQDRQDGGYHVHVHRGGYARRSVDSVKRLLFLARSLDFRGPVSVRLLRAIELQTVALWLHARQGDLLCPLNAGIGRPLRPVLAQAFFERAREAVPAVPRDPAPPPRGKRIARPASSTAAPPPPLFPRAKHG